MNGSPFEDQTLNCFCIHIALQLLLLPVLQVYVNLKMRINCRQLNAQQTVKNKRSKKKKTVQKVKEGEIKFSNQSELAKLYLSPMQQLNFSKLEKCSDVRLLLTIMERAPCFNDEESDLAGKLKKSGNETAHNQADQFTKKYTLHVLDLLEKTFQVVPDSTKNLEEGMRGLQQVKKHGLRALIKNRTIQEISTLIRSLDGMHPSMKATLEATFAGREETLMDIEVVEKKMGGQWQKRPQMDRILCTELELFFQDHISCLQKLLSEDGPQIKLNKFYGVSFKIAKDPFSKGTSRLAYRGHFEKVWGQTSHYFWDSPEVVVKVSSQEASTFQRVHIYAQAFADEWNGLRGREEIDFNWIVSVNLPDFEGTQTIEPYLNKKLYQKW